MAEETGDNGAGVETGILGVPIHPFHPVWSGAGGAVHALGLCWTLHRWVGVGLFLLVVVLAFFSIIRLCFSHPFAGRCCLGLIHVLLLLLGGSRASYLYIDPYNAGSQFAPWLDRVLVTIALPCIAAAFHLLYVVHLIAAKRPLLNGLKHPATVVTITAVHFLLTLTCAVLAGVFKPFHLLQLVAQGFFVLWLLILALIFMASHHLLRQAFLVSSKTFSTQPPSQRDCLRCCCCVSPSLCLTLVAALISVLIVATQVCGMLFIYGGLNTTLYGAHGAPAPWTWWAYHTAMRLGEFLFALLVAIAANLALRHRPPNPYPGVCGFCCASCHREAVLMPPLHAHTGAAIQHQTRFGYDSCRSPMDPHPTSPSPYLTSTSISPHLTSTSTSQNFDLTNLQHHLNHGLEPHLEHKLRHHGASPVHANAPRASTPNTNDGDWSPRCATPGEWVLRCGTPGSRCGTPGSQTSGNKSQTKSLLVVEDGFIRLDLDGNDNGESNSDSIGDENELPEADQDQDQGDMVRVGGPLPPHVHFQQRQRRSASVSAVGGEDDEQKGKDAIWETKRNVFGDAPPFVEKLSLGSDPDLRSLKSDGTWTFRPPSCSISDSIERELNKQGLLTLSGENRGLALALAQKQGSSSSRSGRMRRSALGLQFGEWGQGQGNHGPPESVRRRDSGRAKNFVSHRLSRSLEDFHPSLATAIPEGHEGHAPKGTPHPVGHAPKGTPHPLATPSNLPHPIGTTTDPHPPLATSTPTPKPPNLPPQLSPTSPLQDFSHVRTFKDYQEAVAAKQRLMMMTSSRSKSQENQRV